MSLTEGVEGSRVGLPGQAVGSTEGLGVLLGDWAEDCSRKGFGQSGPLDRLQEKQGRRAWPEPASVSLSVQWETTLSHKELRFLTALLLSPCCADNDLVPRLPESTGPVTHPRSDHTKHAGPPGKDTTTGQWVQTHSASSMSQGQAQARGHQGQDRERGSQPAFRDSLLHTLSAGPHPGLLESDHCVILHTDSRWKRNITSRPERGRRGFLIWSGGSFPTLCRVVLPSGYGRGHSYR